MRLAEVYETEDEVFNALKGFDSEDEVSNALDTSVSES